MFVRYDRYELILKWMTLSLFSYVVNERITWFSRAAGSQPVKCTPADYASRANRIVPDRRRESQTLQECKAIQARVALDGDAREVDNTWYA